MTVANRPKSKMVKNENNNKKNSTHFQKLL